MGGRIAPMGLHVPGFDGVVDVRQGVRHADDITGFPAGLCEDEGPGQVRRGHPHLFRVGGVCVSGREAPDLAGRASRQWKDQGRPVQHGR